MFGNVLIAPVIINRLTASKSTKKVTLAGVSQGIYLFFRNIFYRVGNE